MSSELAFPALAAFSAPRSTVAFGTAFTSPIIPYPGNTPPLAPSAAGGPSLGVAQGIAHVTKVCYTTAGTAHLIGILRPLNVVKFSAPALAGQKVVTVGAFGPLGAAITSTATGDPGVYSTNYHYPIPGGTLATADDPIAAGDYCMYQNADGTWTVDTANGSYVPGTGGTGTITMSTNLLTGGVVAGGLFYYFGLITDTDPATGQIQPQTQIAASQTRDVSWSDGIIGVVNALHVGDPLLFFSTNNTATGVLEYLTGFYAKS